LARKQEHVSG